MTDGIVFRSFQVAGYKYFLFLFVRLSVYISRVDKSP